MVRYENECVGCRDLGLPCLGSTCPNRNVPHFECDECREDFSPDELYDADGQMLCADCILARYQKIAQTL